MPPSLRLLLPPEAARGRPRLAGWVTGSLGYGNGTDTRRDDERGDRVAGRPHRPAAGPGQATHKMSLRTVGDVDEEVLDLLRAAYEQNA